jgi:uncharacterized membrane protein
MLVVFPIGLWTFSLVADLVYLWGLGTSTWSVVAYYTMIGGLVGALLAAVPGLVDLIALHDPKAKRIGIAHMAINLVAVALYASNIYLRSAPGFDTRLPIALSVIGIGLLSVSGWLGGELVYVYGIAVGRPEPAPQPRR